MDGAYGTHMTYRRCSLSDILVLVLVLENFVGPGVRSLGEAGPGVIWKRRVNTYFRGRGRRRERGRLALLAPATDKTDHDPLDDQFLGRD
jgi:hypothetical protein